MIIQSKLLPNGQHLLLLLISFLLVAACDSTNTSTGEGGSLENKKQVLREKRTQLNNLKEEVSKLEEEIEEMDPNTQENIRRLVTVRTVDRENFKRYIDIQASVEEGESVYASSETGGRILKLAVGEGQFVRQGQLIAKLDLETIEKQIAEMEKSRELAQELYDRQKRLWDQNIGSEVQYLQAKNNLERMDKSLETLRFQLTKANVYAPISGYVDEEMLKAGELASAGMPIVSIIKTDVVKVVADVPEAYLTAIEKGETVMVKFPALDIEKEARVSMIGRTINPANRTFTTEVKLPNPEGLFKPNLLAIMKISDFAEENVITVPLELIQQDVNGKDYVYVSGEGSEGPVAQKIYVTTGESFENEIIIREGLEGGEQLIVDGARGLTENELIEVEEQKISQAE